MAVGWADKNRGLPSDLLELLMGEQDLLSDCRVTHIVEAGVAMGVIADVVTCRKCLAHNLDRLPVERGSLDEECCSRLVTGERFQDGPRMVNVATIVEGEGDAVACCRHGADDWHANTH
jgi:hypothetical protein